VENHICFSRGVQVTGAIWWTATIIMVGVGHLVQMTGDGRISRVLDNRTIRMSDDVVYGLYRTHEDEKHVFLG
jgi:hypothetical protein